MNKHTPEPVAKYSDIVSDGGLDPRNKFDVTPAPQPPREWVGLTDEEIESLYFDNFSKKQLRWFAFARAIEAKLKEKNHG
jgi:hypothetical protein